MSQPSGKRKAVQALLCRSRAPVVLIDPDLEALVVPHLERPVRPMLISDFETIARVTYREAASGLGATGDPGPDGAMP